MIYIALGANLPSIHGSPAQTLEEAKKVIVAQGVNVVKSSRTWLTAPVPYDPNQPDYSNAVIEVETDLDAHALLELMLSIETDFGRERSVKNAPRVIDLDLIAYHDEVIGDEPSLIVPHPRMQERGFVLRPMAELNDAWIHPVLKQGISALIEQLPDDQQATPLLEDGA